MLTSVLLYIYLSFEYKIASVDHVDVTRILVNAGCRLEAMDCHYGTPLHAACFKGHVGCAKVLLDAGK